MGALNNIAADTLVLSRPGKCLVVSVTTAGTTTGAVHDCAATGDAADANKVMTIPNTVGVYRLDGWPLSTGLVVIIGTGQVVSVSFQ